MKESIDWAKALINFVGWLLVLAGIYAALKTSFNVMYYKGKYPVDPIIGISSVYPKNEEDCYETSLIGFPENEIGISKSQREQAEKRRERLFKICMARVKKAREEAKIKDIWTSFLFLFIGSGILLTKRFYLKS